MLEDGEALGAAVGTLIAVPVLGSAQKDSISFVGACNVLLDQLYASGDAGTIVQSFLPLCKYAELVTVDAISLCGR